MFASAMKFVDFAFIYSMGIKRNLVEMVTFASRMTVETAIAPTQ